MTIVAWVLFFLSMATTVIAGVLLLLDRNRPRVRQYLGLFLVACALWSIFSVLQSYGWDISVGTVLVRCTFVAALAMAYSMYKFVGALARKHRRGLDVVLLLLTIGAGVISASPLVISSVVVRDGATVPIREPLYIIVILMLVILLAISIITIVRYYLSLQTSKTKSRTQLVMIGLITGIIVGSFTNILLPNWVPELHSARVAWIPAVIWMAPLLYAVVRQGFLDIRTVIIRSGGFILSAVVAGLLYFFVVFAGSFWFGVLSNYGVEEVVANSILIVILAALFPPLKHFFDRFTNAVFGRAYYSRAEVYAQLTDRLARVDTLDALREVVTEVLSSRLQAQNVDVYVVDEQRDLPGDATTLTVQEQEVFVEEFTRTEAASLEFDPYDKPNTLTYIAHRRHVSIVLPFVSQQGVVGLLCMGPISGRLYTGIDRSFLQTVADELSITVEKLLSIEQVRRFNEELQGQIDLATKKLRRTNEQLIEMDATKDEFVSMASHQLRTPLTSVKGYISMVLDGDVGEITPSQRQLLEEAFTSSERMVHLIGDFLNVSRLQTGKFVIDPHACDLAKVVSQEVDGMQQIAAAHGLKIIYKRPARFPTLYIDEGKIRQVIMNFMDNAVYYSPDTASITVSLAIEDGDAVLRVTDKGMGVPKDEQKKLFGKFFRAGNARTQRPDGTGIGLYLAKKVIDGHGGKPVFESTLGKGSTFGFRLPVKKLSKPPVEKELG